jgi:pyrroline-5-carboxylate reductase
MEKISMKIAFIGGGNMGEAILVSVLDKGLSVKEATVISDISKPRRQYLGQQYGVSVTDDSRQAIGNAEVVVLAIKPQNFTEITAELNGRFQPQQLVISIIAGVRLAKLCDGLNHRQVVRVMPNTPAQIGRGMSVWTATPEVTEGQKERAAAILRAMGRELYVADEQDIDRATPISGCGPAYVFLFAEALTSAAMELGLPYDMAQELVAQTMLGSVEFMNKSDKLPADLRRMVTSPGGATAEALAQLEKGQFNQLIKQAVLAAYHKTKALGN